MSKHKNKKIKKTVSRYQPGEPGFDHKITVLTQNDLKLIFYPGRHGLTRIDPVNSVLVENDGFDPKQPETHFLPWLTWFDQYWPGELGLGRKWRFWPETAWKLIFYPGRHGLTSIDPVNSVLAENDGFDPKQPENSFFTLVDMVWPVLTRWTWSWWKDAVDSRTNIFWILNPFLFFFWIFINNNRNKISFEKNLVNPKLGYNSCPLFTMLTVQRHWKIHFLLTLHSKFCKEKRCWEIPRFFSWSNCSRRPARWWKWKQRNLWVVKLFQATCLMIRCEGTRKWSNCSRRPAR